MAAENSETVDDDAPALAGAIVQHAGTVCEHVDHLRYVLGGVSIPVDRLIDQRQQHKVTYGTEPMARLCIYQQIHDLRLSGVVNLLENRPSLLKQLGLETVPDQQVVSYAWGEFSHQTKGILVASAIGIALEARDHGVIVNYPCLLTHRLRGSFLEAGAS